MHPDPLRAILDAPEDAARAREDAYQAKRAAETAAYEAERAYKANDEAKTAADKLRGSILRALYHLPDAEPYTPEPEPYGRRHHEIRYQTHRAHATAYTATQLPRTAARARAYGWTEGTTTTLYESARGTNDPTKLAAELAKANDAARAWIETQTARAYLAAHGIDPDTAPPVSQLVTVETTASTRADYWRDKYTASPRVEYALRMGAEIIATCRTWDAGPTDRETRDARSSGAPILDRDLDDKPDRAQLDADNETAADYWRQWEAEALPTLLAKL